MRELSHLEQTVIACRLCPRLVRYREAVARTKKREFRDWDYWGRPVPGFGDPHAELLVVGLAPAAHGANRTGRMFTGDSSGRWLIRAMYRAGFASQSTTTHPGDGLRLNNAYLTAIVRCAPPDNRPTPKEMANCASYLRQELALLNRVRVVVTLGQVAFQQYLFLARERGAIVPRPRPPFRHAAAYTLSSHNGRPQPVLIASYHPSRQNTQTGRLTEPMLDEVFIGARRLLDSTFASA
ncbi:MAG: uracil-DNA glycosylase [Armatimonadetes bacterium]|nr:uracil-DNA glycosylase [Armatimonadota bacterium]